MKHLDLRYYWLGDQVESGQIAPVFVSTQNQVADILTKPLHRVEVARARTMLGIEI